MPTLVRIEAGLSGVRIAEVELPISAARDISSRKGSRLTKTNPTRVELAVTPLTSKGFPMPRELWNGKLSNKKV